MKKKRKNKGKKSTFKNNEKKTSDTLYILFPLNNKEKRIQL